MKSLQVLILWVVGLIFTLLYIFISGYILETAWSGTIANLVNYQLPLSAAFGVVIFVVTLKGLFMPPEIKENITDFTEAFTKVFAVGVSRLVNLFILWITVICAILLFSVWF